MKKKNFMVPSFKLSLYICLGSLLLVIGILIEEGSYDLLGEKNIFWTLLSGLQLVISLGTFILAVRLMCIDPHWGADRLVSDMKYSASEMSESMILYRKRLEKYSAAKSSIR